MNNEIDCNHLFPKKVHDYIFGDAYKECLKCGEIINSCEYARSYKEKKEKENNKRFLI